MINQKERKFYELSDEVRGFSKPVNWLPLYAEEDDFLSGKVSISLPEFTEEE